MHPLAVNLHLRQALGDAHDDATKPFVRHQHVAAKPHHTHRNAQAATCLQYDTRLARRARLHENVGRTSDTKRRELRHRSVEASRPFVEQLGQRAFQQHAIHCLHPFLGAAPSRAMRLAPW